VLIHYVLCVLLGTLIVSYNKGFSQYGSP
jgi:hypothetical protein